jgi:tetratricopeptide (TPR) repeat protein
MKIFLIIASLSICSMVSFGQSKVDMQIQLLTPDLIGEVTLAKEPFFEWIKKVKSEVEEHLKKENGDKEILVLITLHKEQQASISIGSRPKQDKSSTEELLGKIKKLTSPRTKIVDYSLAIIAQVNNGCSDKDMAFIPKVIFPNEQGLAEFEKLDLANKKISLQNFMTNEVIPVAAAYETTVDAKFGGVRNIGAIMQKGKSGFADVNKVTCNNPDYWRATMEMSKGNQLIPFSKVCMHIAMGEFDAAKNLFSILNFFSEQSSLPAKYYDEISSKLEIIDSELGTEINKGIALHDKGNFNEAMALYENLLKTFPKSAWLNYELYFSRTAGIKDMDEIDREWNKSKKVIYQCDPLYPINVRAKTGKEGYLLFRRQELKTLFKSKENYRKDFVKYADIALELEDYGSAAQLYWLILTYFSKDDYNDRDMLSYYLYCLDKLGDKETIKNFKDDFLNKFKKVEKEQKKIMEESSIYKSFAKKE